VQIFFFCRPNTFFLLKKQSYLVHPRITFLKIAFSNRFLMKEGRTADRFKKPTDILVANFFNESLKGNEMTRPLRLARPKRLLGPSLLTPPNP
jgi:hypothetical protein